MAASSENDSIVQKIVNILIDANSNSLKSDKKNLENMARAIPKSEMNIWFQLHNKYRIYEYGTRSFRLATFLMLASHLKFHKCMQILLERGADPNKTDENDYYRHSPLLIAIKNQDKKAVTILLSFNTKIQTIFYSNICMEHFDPYSILFSSNEILNFLKLDENTKYIIDLISKIQPTEKNFSCNACKWVYIMTFVPMFSHTDTNIAFYLITQFEHNINRKMKGGNTYLHYCIYDCKPYLFEKLVQYGADIHIPNNEGLTPLMLLMKIWDPRVNCLVEKEPISYNEYSEKEYINPYEYIFRFIEKHLQSSICLDDDLSIHAQT